MRMCGKGPNVKWDGQVYHQADEMLLRQLTVVATGGLAPCIMPCCTRKVIYDSDLLFKGLAILYSKNAE